LLVDDYLILLMWIWLGEDILIFECKVHLCEAFNLQSKNQIKDHNVSSSWAKESKAATTVDWVTMHGPCMQ